MAVWKKIKALTWHYDNSPFSLLSGYLDIRKNGSEGKT